MISGGRAGRLGPGLERICKIVRLEAWVRSESDWEGEGEGGGGDCDGARGGGGGGGDCDGAGDGADMLSADMGLVLVAVEEEKGP